jgi:hypothetical protein
VPIIVGRIVFGSEEEKPEAMRGVVYFIPERTQRMPDLSLLEPVAAFFTHELNISPRDFSEGFPGVNNRFEWFAIRYDGTFSVKTDGVYDFRIVSDDGAKVYVDNALLIDNDGLHATKSTNGKVRLAPGLHAIRVDYFQGPRMSIALQLFVKPPGPGAERPFHTRL